MIKEKYFQKELGNSDRAMKMLHFGVIEGREIPTAESQRYFQITQKVAKTYDAYRSAQDEFDEAWEEGNEKRQNYAMSRLVEFVLILNCKDEKSQKLGMSIEDFKSYRVAGALNHTSSICSKIILLEDALEKVKNPKEKDKTQAQNLIKEFQTRFQNYQLGDSCPVDQASDLFLSNLVPMLLAYNGIAVNKNFAVKLKKELEEMEEEVPRELENFVSKNKTISFVSSTKTNELNLQDLIDNYQIKQMMKTYLEQNDSQSLENLQFVVVDLIKRYDIKEADLNQLEIDENLGKFMKINCQIINGEENDEFVQAIKDDFEKYKTSKNSNKKSVAIMLYAPIFKKEQELAKKEPKSKSCLKNKKEETKTELKKLDLENIPVSKPTPTTKPLSATSKTKQQQTTTKQGKTLATKEDTKPKQQEQSYDDVMLDFAKFLFMNQENYNLEKLSKVKIEVTKHIFGEEIKYYEFPFGDVLTSTKHSVEKGKDVVVLKNLPETYVDVRKGFSALDSKIQKGLLNGLEYGNGQNYVDSAKRICKDLIKNYGVLCDSDKKIIEDLALKNSTIKKELISSKESFAKKQSKDINMMKDIMEKYNLSQPKSSKESKAEAEESIKDFFTNLN